MTENRSLTLVDTVRKMKPNFEALLKATGTDIERFQNNAIMAISNNKDIAGGVVASKSVFNVCSRAAQDGVMLDGKEAAIVIGFSNGAKEAQYRLMVGGIVKMIHRSPDIKRIIAQVLYANDIVDIQLAPDSGTNPVSHKIDFKQDRGDIVGAYAYAELSTGEYTSPEYMSIKQIEAIRDNYSKQKDSGMWKNSFDEACIKTVLHRAAKRLPLGSAIVNTIDDDMSIDEPLNITPEPEGKPKRKTAMDKVKEQAAVIEEPVIIENIPMPDVYDDDEIPM